MKGPKHSPARVAAALTLTLLAPAARAQDDGAAAPRVPTSDPTGGAYTSPTLLFTSAAALPPLNVRVTTGVDLQSPSDAFYGVRPLLNAELGLPARFTLAGGTSWVGGDTLSAADGFSPFAQVRYQIFGAADGLGALGGASLTYKRVGYRGGENELEASFSFQYRRPRFEFGAQGVFGQSLEEGEEHDLEARVYGAFRVVPSLAVGLSAQLRGDIGEEEEERAAARAGRSEFDLIGGAMASFTSGRWQAGALVGASTIGLYERAGFLAQLFGSARF
jgi:hypothetical protein